MARPRNPNRDKAKKIWLESGGTITNRSIAEKLGESEKTVSVWKLRDKWNEVLQTDECSTTNDTSNEVPEIVVEKNLDKAMLESVEENNDLTDKQKLFCYYVASGYSGVKAYMEAYGCKYDSARANAYRLMEIDGVKECISELKQVVSDFEIIPTASEVLERHAKIYYAKYSDYIDYGTEEVADEYGRLATKNYLYFKDPSEIDEEIISSVTLGKDGAKIELDKADALKFWTRYHGLNPMDRHKIENDNAKLEIEKQKLNEYDTRIDDVKIEVDYGDDT